jgi:hypothetical protein
VTRFRRAYAGSHNTGLADALIAETAEQIRAQLVTLQALSDAIGSSDSLSQVAVVGDGWISDRTVIVTRL